MVDESDAGGRGELLPSVELGVRVVQRVVRTRPTELGLDPGPCFQYFGQSRYVRVATAAGHRRAGRIYVDPLRNVRDAVAIGTFSTRAREGAPVAVPLSWRELEASQGPPNLSVRDAAEVDWKARDPWKGYRETRQAIKRRAREALGLV